MPRKTQSHDLRREETRKLIGATLLALLLLIVLFGFAALAVIGREAYELQRDAAAAIHSKEDAARLAAATSIASAEAKAGTERLALLLNIVFGPVVTLVGSVTGFYFGTRSSRPPSG